MSTRYPPVAYLGIPGVGLEQVSIEALPREGDVVMDGDKGYVVDGVVWQYPAGFAFQAQVVAHLRETSAS